MFKIIATKVGTCCLAILLISALNGCLSPRPQEPQNNQATIELLQTSASEQKSQYTLLPSDEINIQSMRHTSLNQQARVDSYGYISYPFVGQIKAEGLTTTELAQKLEEELASSGQYKITQMHVSMLSPEQQEIYVIGEVENPGKIALTKPITLIEALSQAGGQTRDAELSNVLLVRSRSEPAGAAVFNIKDFYKGKGDPRLASFPLRSGDLIFIPSTLMSDIEYFFDQVNTVVSAIVNIERGIVLYPDVRKIIETGKLTDDNGGDRTIVVSP